MKTYEKENRIELYVKDDTGTKKPCYWQYGWVIGYGDALSKRAFFEHRTQPKPGQVIGYKPVYFAPTYGATVVYIMDRVCQLYARATPLPIKELLEMGGMAAQVHSLFLKRCSKARVAVADLPDSKGVDLIMNDPELFRLWLDFVIDEEAILKELAEHYAKSRE